MSISPDQAPTQHLSTARHRRRAPARGRVPAGRPRLRPPGGRRVRGRADGARGRARGPPAAREGRAPRARRGRRADRRDPAAARNETADELAARSRAQAEGRLQRAEREAEILKAEADKYAEQVAVDTRRLWAERQHLIEEVRRLADEVLATADDAMERLTPPEAVAAALTPEEPARGATDAAAGHAGLLRARRRRTRSLSLERQLAARRACPWRRSCSWPCASVPNDLESRRPIGPGALPPALCPTPSVRSTPRCGPRERRGSRKPSTRRTMQTATMAAIVMTRTYPGLIRPKPQHEPG